MNSNEGVSQPTYLRGALAPPGEGVEEADAGWGHQKQGEDDIVLRGEVHLHHLNHDDAAAAAGDRGLGQAGCRVKGRRRGPITVLLAASFHEEEGLRTPQRAEQQSRVTYWGSNNEGLRHFMWMWKEDD